MKAIYLGVGQSLDDQVTEINSIVSAYGTLKEVTSTNSDFCWGSWSCCDAIAIISDNISSITMDNGSPYSPDVVSLVGGRPSRPIAK